MLNDALKIIRKFHKLNQTELADALGVSTSHISEIESGKNTITLEMLEKYANYFNVPTSHLMLFAESLPSSAENNKVPNKLKNFIASSLLKILTWQVEKDEKKNTD